MNLGQHLFFSLFPALCFLGSAFGEGVMDDNDAVPKRDVSEYRKILAEVDQLDREVALEKLGRVTYRLVRKERYDEKDWEEIKNGVMEKMTSIEGYADYFSGVAKKISENSKASENNLPIPYPELDAIDSRRAYYIDVLGQIPTIDSVRALGDMLSDDQLLVPVDELSKRGLMDAPPLGPNGLYAQTSLGKILEKPPLPLIADDYSMEDLPEWQRWYQEVKSGRRTFRLKGDPQNYSLTGPVAEERTPVDRRDRVNRAVPEAGTSPALSQAETTSSSRFRLAALIAACGVLSAGLWQVLRARRAGSER